MKKYELLRETILPITINQAWDFFGNPHNLALITPPEMGFKVLTKSLPSEIHNGLKISYLVKPLLGIPLPWLSEISSVNAPFTFVDEQLKGPYAYWHHEHIFEEKDGKTLMIDKVTYGLPFGVLGRLMNNWIVAKKLKHIFDFRALKIETLFKEV